MAIANTTTGIWVNSDGLRIKFGAAEGVLGESGEYMVNSSTHLTEYDIVYTDVAQGLTTTNVFILDYDTVFPDTAIIDKVEFVTGTAWATDTSIEFGFVKRSDFTTIVDADGLLDAFVVGARDAAGETTTVLPGGTYAGALMGVQTGIGFDSVLSTHWLGAAPTAGTGKLRIFWRYAVDTVQS